MQTPNPPVPWPGIFADIFADIFAGTAGYGILLFEQWHIVILAEYFLRDMCHTFPYVVISNIHVNLRGRFFVPWYVSAKHT